MALFSILTINKWQYQLDSNRPSSHAHEHEHEHERKLNCDFKIYYVKFDI